MSGSPSSAALTSLPHYHDSGNNKAEAGGSGEMETTSLETNNGSCVMNSLQTSIPKFTHLAMTVTTTVTTTVSSSSPLLVTSCSLVPAASKPSSPAVASPTLVNFPVELPLRRPAPPSFCAHQPATKRARFDGCALGNKPFSTGEVRQALIRWKRGKMEAVRDSYNRHIAESFFLTHDGNLMDMGGWLKRPTPELLAHHKQHRLEGDTSNLATSVRDSALKMSSSGMNKKEDQQDQMVEKARHEASVVARIAQLRKEGLWTEKRLPKVHEPPRPKCHWDYLLEEMVWLSADFAQERKWKKAAAKKCAKMVQKYFQDKELAAERAQKEEEMRLKKIASFMAREIRIFWSNVEKLVHFKINSKHEEKKKKALDQQLSFIVDQTEKYSGMLAESMKRPADSSAVSTRSETPSVGSLSDDEFEPSSNSEDDEATIAKEDDDPNQQATEVQLLQQESGQTMDDLLTSLPPEYLESLRVQAAGQHLDEECQAPDSKGEPATTSSSADADVPAAASDAPVHSFTRSGRKRKLSSAASLPDESVEAPAEGPSTSSDVKEQGGTSAGQTPGCTHEQAMDVDDDEYVAKDEDDDEETLAEQEQHEGKPDYEKEIAELQADNDLSLEELRRKYASFPSLALPSSQPSEAEDNDDDSSADEEDMALQPCSGEPSVADDDEDNGLTGSSDGDSDDDGSDDEEVGLKSLLDEAMETEPSDSTAAAEAADQQLEQATAVAEALQPKGFTLSSTAVTTPVPFLLKHTLREYQHVGLDWLVTMYDKSLNGILADEMGLGKTIQTISLLAHLACVMGNWGPHLIVVPTSVMLNWEMELKKWCPAFKILTYFGTQKERKMKRTGWTKLNAFHVCITSYKLVIQDHQSFRRKKWKYFILDEAQNIKNFKSKRWQLLLNFQSDRRLLLTGTPLQNNLMELWSLMHFLMPHVFTSHREFREWFSNPVSGMIQGNSEYNDNIIKRLHKVLRPFILRRLKSEVEQQMPKKYEHVVMCRLSKRQRFLYEEFMSRTKTKETLASGNFLSVINVLMQLRKVCNHPNLFEERPTVSPFMMEPLAFTAPSCCWAIAAYDPFKHVDLFSLNLLLCALEMSLTAFAAHRVRRFQCPQRSIIEIDNAPPLPPRCPPGKIRLHVRQTNKPSASSHGPANGGHPLASAGGVALNRPRPLGSIQQGVSAVPSVAPVSNVSTGSNVRYQLIQHQGALRAIPIAVNAGAARPGAATAVRGAATVAKPAVAGTQQLQGLQLMHTASGQLLLTAATRPQQVSTTAPASVASPTTLQGVSTSGASALLQKIQSLQGFKNLQGSVFTLSPGGRPVLRLPPPTTAAAKPAQASPSVGVAQAVSGAVQQARSTPQGTPQHTPLPTPLPSPTGTGSPARPTPESRSPARSSRSSAPTPSSGAGAGAASKLEDGKRIFHLSDLEESRAEARRAKLSTLARLNTRRCRACPIYGGDLIEAVTVPSRLPLDGLWHSTSTLRQLVWSEERRLHYMKGLLDRFVLCVPAVVSSNAQLVLHHPDPSEMVRCEHTQRQVVQLLAPAALRLHAVTNSQLTQFPDPRLIQYDCGKLQTLDRLLRTLKTEGHRVLIFTQMTRMLDVFEAFLNYHGHIYLRLDGTTKVQDRQVLMERFNQDKRIFCFILSTRSGGIGVNLTGADTVIFYDSDWNPTMDAQAQDRCHRIGQTRDVHIYRLISEKTIEENILKKANQKRMLGNLAIEGGNFTTAYFKEQTIQELFSVSSEADASHRMAELLDRQGGADGAADAGANIKSGALENALAAAEDETDVVAARYAMAEAAADLAEFDETIPLNEDSNASGATAAAPGAEKEESSKVELEINKLMQQLTGVERYAMHVLESADEGIALEQHRLEQQLEQQKREWELDRQRALQSTDPLMQAGVKRPLQDDDDDDDDEDPLTVPADQVWLPVLENGGLSLWLPPTPPRGAGDLFMDQSPPGYHKHIMPESSLPPVSLRAPRPKRMRLTSTEGERPRHSEEVLAVPRSLFDRAPPSSNTLRFKREFPLHKFRNSGRTATGVRPVSSPGSGPNNGPAKEEVLVFEWSQQEDANILLFIGQCGHESSHAAHIVNWDLLCDQVNKVSRVYRSPRACRSRYDGFLSKVSNVNQKQLPDGSSPVASSSGSSTTATDNARLVALASAGMAHRSLPKTKSRGTSSSGSNLTDNSDYCAEATYRFDTLKRIKNKLAPTVKPLTLAVSPGSSLRNAKNNIQILAQAGINFDSPLTPEYIASSRPERMKEKQKLYDQSRQNNAQQQPLQQQQQILQQPGVQQVAGGAVLQQQQPAQLQQQHQLLAQHQQHTVTLPQQHVNASSIHQHHQQQQILGSVVVSRNAVVVSSSGQSTVTGLLTTAATITGAVPMSATVTTAAGSGGNASNSVVVPSSATSIGTPQVVTVASLASGLIATANIASNSSVSTAAALLTSGASSTVRPIAASVPLAVSSIGTGPRTTKLTAALQELRPQTQGATVVSMTPLAQIQAAAKFSQPIQVTGIQTKAGVSGPRTLTPSQLTYIHPPQTIKRLQIGASTAAGQKIPVAVSGTSLQGIAAIQVSQANRGQMLKHGGAAVVSVTTSAAALLPQQSKTLTRTVTDAEMTAIIRRQQQQQHAKAGSLTQVGSIALSSASLLASGGNIITTGSSASAGTSVATILKAAGAVSTQSSSAGLTLSAKQQLQQRVTAATTVMKGTTVGLQLGTKGSSGASSLGTLQIIQGAPGQKSGGMQQIQVFKQVNPQTVHHLASASAHGGAVLATAKNVSSSATGTTKLLPASVSHQGIRQTIQVVSAGGSLVGTPGSGGTIRVSGAGTGSPTLTLPASAVRMATPQLLSQVSAALQQGQTVTVPVRGTSGAGGAPASVRISQPITVQSQQLALQQVQQQQQAAQLAQSQQQPSSQP